MGLWGSIVLPEMHFVKIKIKMIVSDGLGRICKYDEHRRGPLISARAPLYI
jgi:hypothetical protein